MEILLGRGGKGVIQGGKGFKKANLELHTYWMVPRRDDQCNIGIT